MSPFGDKREKDHSIFVHFIFTFHFVSFYRKPFCKQTKTAWFLLILLCKRNSYNTSEVFLLSLYLIYTLLVIVTYCSISYFFFSTYTLLLVNFSTVNLLYVIFLAFLLYKITNHCNIFFPYSVCFPFFSLPLFFSKYE